MRGCALVVNQDRLADILDAANRHSQVRDQILSSLDNAEVAVYRAAEARQALEQRVKDDMDATHGPAHRLQEVVEVKVLQHETELHVQRKTLERIRKGLKTAQKMKKKVEDASQCWCLSSSACAFFESTNCLWFLVVVSLCVSIVLLSGFIQAVR